MSLEELLNQQKEQTSGKVLNERQVSEEMSELRKQNELLRKRMIEIENDQDKRNKQIDRLIKSLDSGIAKWNSELSELPRDLKFEMLKEIRDNSNYAYHLAEEQKRFLKESFEKRNDLNDKLNKFKTYSLATVHVLALVLALSLIFKILTEGMWNTLGVSYLWSLEEWYWKLSAVGIVVVVIGGLIALIFKGVQSIGNRY